MQTFLFYQNHLNLVSRSFALVISKLTPEPRLYVAHSYLLFRVIDTIEDAEIEVQQKLIFLKSVLNTLENQVVPHDFKLELKNTFKNSTSADENLVHDLSLLISDFTEFPKAIQNIIFDAAKTMIMGMTNHLQLFQNNTLKLKSEVELNFYCFFVAGIIGEMLTRMMSSIYKDLNFCNENIANSISFGLFLQKINILKDEQEDNKRQIFYFENADQIYRSIMKNIIATQDYINKIPQKWFDYKLFCIFSAGLGIISLISKKIRSENRTLTTWTRTDINFYFNELEYQLKMDSQFDLSQAVQLFFQKLNIQINPLDYLAQIQPTTSSIKYSSFENRYTLDQNYFGIMNTQLLENILTES